MNEPTAPDKVAPLSGSEYFAHAGGAEISGSWVVIGLLFMGVVASGIVYTYWDLHTRPFRPLTEAIGREFQSSLPKVGGGRLKKKSEMMLRVAMRVPFDPEQESHETQKVVMRLKELIAQHHSPENYQSFDFLLMQMRPEASAKTKLLTFTYQQLFVDAEPLSAVETKE